MRHTILTLVCALFVQTILTAQDNPLIQNPSISPDGAQIAFCYQGDIWTSSADGANLNRLTIHEAYDSNPIWNHDSSKILFSSDRFGNNDIFVVGANGGTPQRITYHSAGDVVTDVTDDGTVYISTSRNFRQLEREGEVHTVSIKGGTPFRALGALGFDARLSPNSKFIVLTKGTCRIDREAYKGPANRDIWLYDIANDTYKQLTTFDGQDFSPYWGNNETIYFQSARSGRYNIHKMNIDAVGNKTGTIEQITNFSKMGISSFHVNKSGNKAILISGDKTSIVDLASKQLKSVKISIHSDYRFDPVVKRSFSSNASEISASPNGKLGALVVRGEVFVTEIDKEKSRTVNLSNSPYRDLDVWWLNDDCLLFVSDRDGASNIYKVTSSDASNSNLFTSLKHEVSKLTDSKKGIRSISIAPSKKKISYIEGNGKLVVASIDSLGKISKRNTLIDTWDNAGSVAWSPDSQWVSYSLSDLYFNEEIFIHKADNSQKPVNISMHPKSDMGPIWTKDGSKLVFSSNRNNGDHDVWFVWLKKSDWEKTQQDWEESPADSKDKKSKDKKEVVVKIDFENIYERQVQVTSFTGGEYATAVSNDGETIYYVSGNSGRGNPSVTSDLFSIKWNGKDKKEVTKGNSSPRNISLNEKGDYLYYISRGRTARIKLAGAKRESLPFSAKMRVDFTAESDQIFEEAWATIRDRFYDPNHHNQDWSALKKTYKPLAMKASTRADFKTVFNKMLGQVNASHMGMYSGEERKSVQNERTGMLGMEYQPNNDGSLRVTSVIPNSAADRETSKIIPGDVVLSMNGEKVSADENIYKYLEGTANEKIILEVSRNGQIREVVIRPKSSVRTDNYNAWVKERKRLTDVYSGGRLGYIHIQGMNWPSFERFERELAAAGHGKEGIVIDVRYNGGGWTTDYLMAVLNVKQHAYTVPRGAAKDVAKEHKNFTGYYPFSERLPLAAWTKPSIALCNASSYSNAEIFSHAYKELDLGTLVGVPTFGAVISTGGQTLIDGSYVRVPFRGWFVKSSEKNMDFTPAMPDIVVYDTPDEKAKGIDSQLKRAVEELLNQL